jgi:cytochrome b
MTRTEAHRSARGVAAPYIRVWDVPTRLFHWTMASLVGISWYSGSQGLMKLHLWSGLTLLALLLFRIAWGVVGSTTARFSDFVAGPRKVGNYFRVLMTDNKPLYAGHNPAGGLMVMALIAVLLAQAITGLFSNDGIRFNGPLALWVSTDISDRLAEVHGILFNVILLLVWMHLVAVFFYLFVKGENLLKPMLTGYKHRAHLPAKLNLKFAHWAIALVALAAAAAGVVGLISFL